MSVNYSVRESGDERPAPAGDYDGQSRAATMRALLAKAEAEPVTEDQEPPKRPLMVRLLGDRSLMSWLFD